MTTGVVMPVRGFRTGKVRLGARLADGERAALLESMASTVVAAAEHRPVVVVTSALDVRAWAEDLGLEVVNDPGSLNDAVDAGRTFWRRRGATRVVLVHADLPYARSLDALDPPDHVAGGSPVFAVACHRDDGTPALSIPADVDFRFAYGIGSFARHRQEARRLGLPFVRVDDDGLRFDVDTIADLDTLVVGSHYQ